MSALREFNEELKQAEDLLEKIERYIDIYKASVKHEFIHWGHVGDIASIKSQLQEVVNCFSGE